MINYSGVGIAMISIGWIDIGTWIEFISLTQYLETNDTNEIH